MCQSKTAGTPFATQILQAHTRVHTGVAFKCDVATYDKAQPKVQPEGTQQEPYGGRPYKCAVVSCGKAFRRPCDLKI